MTVSTFVIIGAALAGAKAAETLRSEGFDGRVVLIGEEQRAAVRAAAAVQGLPARQGRRGRRSSSRSADWYAEHDVELRPRPARRPRSTGAAHQVVLDRRRPGSATTSCCSPPGRVARHLRRARARTAGNVHYLRTVGDSERLREAISAGGRRGRRRRRLDRAGDRGRGAPLRRRGHRRRAGADAAARGARPRARRASSPTLHRDHGVAAADRIGVHRRLGEPGSVVTTSGRGAARRRGRHRRRHPARRRSWPSRPGSPWTTASSSTSSLRTSDPDIFAAGDVANAYHPLLGRHIRVEHWANALNGGPAAARAMLGPASRTTGCRTSSPTSTTWAWSTPGTPRRATTTRSSSAATLAAAGVRRVLAEGRPGRSPG